VGEVRYSAGSNGGNAAEIHYLHQEPEADEQRSGDKGDPDEDQEEDDGPDAVARVGDQEGAHHSGDGSAGAEARDTRERIADDLTHHRDRPSKEVEEDEAASAHGVFDLAAECPEVDHVADDVHPAGVHEHRGEDCYPAVSVNDADGNHGPDPDEPVPVRELFQEYICVENDDRNRGDSKASQRPRGVAQRYETTHLHSAFAEKNTDSICDGAFDRADNCHFQT